MKRLWLVSLALTLVFTLAACGGGAGGATDGATDGASGGEGSTRPADEIATVEDMKAFLAENYADAEWYADVTDLTLETMLGAQVLAFNVTWTSMPDDYEVANRKTQAIIDLANSTEQSIAPNVVIVLADGAIQFAGSSSVVGDAGPMNTALDLPPAPTTAAEVEQWLATVYGPGGLVTLGADETWYDSIQSIGMETVADDPTLTVTTSAPSYYSRDASLLNMALMSTGSPLLANYGITTADGAGSAGTAPAQEPGMAGFYYPMQ